MTTVDPRPRLQTGNTQVNKISHSSSSLLRWNTVLGSSCMKKVQRYISVKQLKTTIENDPGLKGLFAL